MFRFLIALIENFTPTGKYPIYVNITTLLGNI